MIEMLIFVSLACSIIALVTAITVALFQPTKADRAAVIRAEIQDQLAQGGWR